MEDFFKKLSIYGSIAKEEGQKIAQSALNKGKELADITKLRNRRVTACKKKRC